MKKRNIKAVTQKDFDWVTLSPKRLENKSQEIIENRKSDLVEIKNIESKERTFLNTVFALEKSDRDVDGFFGKLEVLLHMSPKKPIREKCAQIEVKMSAQLIEIDFDKGIFDALVEYKKNYKNDKLKDIDKKLFKDYLRAYTKMGFDLKAKEQTELKKVNKEISKLSSAFSVNINNYTDNILLGNDDLEGLSDIFIQSLKKEKDKYIVSLDYPEMIPFMETSSNEKKRKQLLDKASKKGGKENLKILSEILKLKDKRAKMLGYKNHPDFIAEDRMSKKGKNVVDFYEPLLEKLEKPGRADLKILEYCKKEQTGDLKEKLQPQDIAYYANILKKQKYNVDEQKLKEYFQLDIVKFEMIEMFGKLFGFEMKKNNKIKLWHSDVEFYDLYTKGEKIAHIIFDLHPRKGKFGHAAMFHTQEGYEIDFNKNVFQAPVAAIVCNFGKATAKIPALIGIREIETLFHEFGHSLHFVLSEAKFNTYSGTNVAWDFVETPSQLLENWFWNEKVIKKLSQHFKTKAVLSKTEIKNIISSEKFFKGYAFLRQVLMTKLDYELHSKKILSPEEYWKKLLKKHTGLKASKESLFPSGFEHIIGGYDAGYYSYLWALVYSDDIFSEFEKKGIFNKSLGKKYRKEILAVGGSRDETESVSKFLGRKSNNKAFLRKLGIK